MQLLGEKRMWHFLCTLPDTIYLISHGYLCPLTTKPICDQNKQKNGTIQKNMQIMLQSSNLWYRRYSRKINRLSSFGLNETVAIIHSCQMVTIGPDLWELRAFLNIDRRDGSASHMSRGGVSKYTTDWLRCFSKYIPFHF